MKRFGFLSRHLEKVLQQGRGSFVPVIKPTVKRGFGKGTQCMTLRPQNFYYNRWSYETTEDDIIEERQQRVVQGGHFKKKLSQEEMAKAAVLKTFTFAVLILIFSMLFREKKVPKE